MSDQPRRYGGFTQPKPGYVFGGTKACSGCGKLIAWWTTPNDKRSPHDADGTSHFATCPKAQRFRKPKPKLEPEPLPPPPEPEPEPVGALTFGVDRPCPACKGKRAVHGMSCPACDGTGWERRG